MQKKNLNAETQSVSQAVKMRIQEKLKSSSFSCSEKRQKNRSSYKEQISRKEQ